MSPQIEVGMVGQVDRGCCGTWGGVTDDEFVVIGQFVRHTNGHLTGIMSVTVFTDKFQDYFLILNGSCP